MLSRISVPPQLVANWRSKSRGVLFPASGRIEADEQTIFSVRVAHESRQAGSGNFKRLSARARQAGQADGFSSRHAPPQ